MRRKVLRRVTGFGMLCVALLGATAGTANAFSPEALAIGALLTAEDNANPNMQPINGSVVCNLNGEATGSPEMHLPDGNLRQARDDALSAAQCVNGDALDITEPFQMTVTIEFEAFTLQGFSGSWDPIAGTLATCSLNVIAVGEIRCPHQYLYDLGHGSLNLPHRAHLKIEAGDYTRNLYIGPWDMDTIGDEGPI